MNSTTWFTPAIWTGRCTTGRNSRCPFDERIQRVSSSRASSCTGSRVELCQGSTVKRTHSWPLRMNFVTLRAWMADVRAPVSILALIHIAPCSGKATHSRQPSSRWGRALAFRPAGLSPGRPSEDLSDVVVDRIEAPPPALGRPPPRGTPEMTRLFAQRWLASFRLKILAFMWSRLR